MHANIHDFRLAIAVLLLAGPSASLFAQADAKNTAGIEFFEKKIRPVLVDHCYQCHSSKAAKLKGNLLLDTRAGMLKGGDSGPAIVPGQAEKSLLFKALKQSDDLRMPPKGKLSDEILADFAKWIALGAPDPRESSNVAVKGIDWSTARQFWAFQLPVKHPLPAVKDRAWPKRDIDHFLLAEMEKHGLKPVRPATKLELIRRATFDLIGLPPTPEEVDAFAKDASPDAFAKVVDRLLASPHYGERWGRYWLDVSRFAEDRALAKSEPYPHAHRYRDWVVQAFNQDMPYDSFVRLQLAGDLLKEPDDTFVRLAGLGFQGLGAEYHKGNFAAQVMADELDDRVDTLSRGLLGLTVACARCHDHKYDPIPTVDYYSLAAAYQGSTLSMLPVASPAEAEKFNAWQQEAKKKETRLAQLLQKKADRKELDALKAELEAHKKTAPKAPLMIHGVKGGGQAMRVNIRGNVERLGEPAPPGFLQILRRKDPGPAAKPPFTRLELADAIATPDNPLTARVFINRVWAHHFGRGIVGTTSNFGKLGDRPTHPELLDTLAVRFIEAGWSVKWLQREIMLSAAYQLGSASDADNSAKDTENRYLWHMSPRRLDVEAWRDAVLMVSGRIDLTLGGPSFELGDAKANHVRRTIYARVSRVTPNSMLTMFDFPDANVSNARRSVTTIPQQQLFVLNSDFMIESAKAFAARLEKAAKEDEARIDLAFRLAYGRAPEPAEKQLGLEFLRAPVQGGAAGPADRLTPWQQYAQAILATNEFAWID